MGWLALLRTLLSLAGSLIGYRQQKQLLDAGEAKAIKEGLEKQNDIIDKANKARIDARNKFNDSNGVLDESDQNLRD